VIKQDISENLVNSVYLGIGSNLGNRKKNIEKAKYLLTKNPVKIVKSSSIYETYSWPNKKHPKFYNIVIKIITELKPINLFFLIKDIEKKLGRKKSKVNAPRTCDIDIIDYKGKTINFKYRNSTFIVPHEKLTYRNFVLYPLHEIAPNWCHPKTKEKIGSLIEKLPEEDRKSILKIKKY